MSQNQSEPNDNKNPVSPESKVKTSESQANFLTRIFVRLPAFIKNYRWALLSGVMMGTSYIPLPPWALAFCWVPLWLDLLSENSLRRVFWKAWWSQFVLTLIGFHWIAYVAHEFGYLPWPIAIAIAIAFAGFVHLYIPLACLAAKWLEKRVKLQAPAVLLLLALFHNLGETLWPSIFPWNLGYPLLGAHMPIAQLADFIGFLGLSLVMHLSSVAIALLLLSRDRILLLAGGAFLVVTLALLNFWGHLHGQRWQSGDKTLKVLQVQANIGNLEKVMAEKGAGFQREIMTKYFTLTRDALAKSAPVDLVIWPESAYPDFLGAHNGHRFYTNELVRFVQEIKTPLITGGYANDPPGSANRQEYNGMFLYQPDGLPLAPEYHKTYLLVFGEWVPLGDLFPILKQLNPGGPGFGRGSGPVVFDYHNLKIGPQVCYEGLYPEFAEAQVKNGAQILVNLTNDSWFGPSFEPYQHMYMTLGRAIETRRPLLRSTNTGVTTAIAADGTLFEQSPTFTEWTGVFEIPYREQGETTLYTRYGGWWPWLLIAFSLLTVLGGRRRAV